MNGEVIDIHMKLGENGEAFFVHPIDDAFNETIVATSPLPPLYDQIRDELNVKSSDIVSEVSRLLDEASDITEAGLLPPLPRSDSDATIQEDTAIVVPVPDISSDANSDRKRSVNDASQVNATPEEIFQDTFLETGNYVSLKKKPNVEGKDDPSCSKDSSSASSTLTEEVSLTSSISKEESTPLTPLTSKKEVSQSKTSPKKNNHLRTQSSGDVFVKTGRSTNRRKRRRRPASSYAGTIRYNCEHL